MHISNQTVHKYNEMGESRVGDGGHISCLTVMAFILLVNFHPEC